MNSSQIDLPTLHGPYTVWVIGLRPNPVKWWGDKVFYEKSDAEDYASRCSRISPPTIYEVTCYVREAE